MKEFVTLEDILNLYCISRRTVRTILRNNKIHFHDDRDTVYINFKEFHKVYTTKYNPALFTEADCNRVVEKVETLKEIVDSKENRTFFNIFTTPVDRHINMKRVAVSYAS